MDFNKTVDLIIKDLNEAGEIIDDLKNYPGVPAIQVELAKSKCRNAAEVISLFKNLQNQVQPEPERDMNVSEPAKEASKGAKLNVGPKPEDRSQRTEVRSRKPEAAIQSSVSDDKESSIPSKKNPESTIIADTFDHLPDSLNAKLGSMRDDDVVPDYLKAKPLANLSQAIGVNDKFLFIRELFNGNPDSYDQAIDTIDQAKSLSDAKALMINYAGDKSETEAGRQLLDLVKRKFPADE